MENYSIDNSKLVNFEKSWWKLDGLDIFGLSTLFLWAGLINIANNLNFFETFIFCGAMGAFYVGAGFISFMVGIVRINDKEFHGRAVVGSILGLILFNFGLSGLPIVLLVSIIIGFLVLIYPRKRI